MEQEVLIIWEKYWKEQNHHFKARGHYSVALCEKLTFQKLALLSSFDGDSDPTVFYHGMAYFEVEYKTFRGKDIVPYKYICLKTINQVKFIFEQGIDLLSFQVFT